MEPAWHSAVEIAVSVFAFCAALTIDLWLFATAPPHRLWLSLVSWIGLVFVALTPLVFFGRAAGWLMAAPILGATFWGAIELRRRWNRWIYAEWPARRQKEEAFRAYKSKAFDG